MGDSQDASFIGWLKGFILGKSRITYVYVTVRLYMNQEILCMHSKKKKSSEVIKKNALISNKCFKKCTLNCFLVVMICE